MRLIAVMPDETQVGSLIDSLKNLGFDRDELIVMDLADEQNQPKPKDANDELSFLKTEREGLWEFGAFSKGIKGLKHDQGILVAVETPKHRAHTVKMLMIQNGATQIIQD